MIIDDAYLLEWDELKEELVAKLLAWARGEDYANRTVICVLFDTDSKRRYRVSDGLRPRLSVFNDIKIIAGGHKFMLGFYEQRSRRQPRVPRYWWYSRSGGDWKVGLGHDDNDLTNKNDSERIRKGANREDEKLGYTFETVLPWHLDIRLRDVAKRIDEEDDARIYEIDNFWNYLTLWKYYKRPPSRCPSDIRNDPELGKLLDYSPHHALAGRIPRGDGTFYASLGEFFSCTARGVTATYASRRFGHHYQDCEAAANMLTGTLTGGSRGTGALMSPLTYTRDEGDDSDMTREELARGSKAALAEQRKYKRSTLMAQFVKEARKRKNREEGQSEFDLTGDKCTFYRIKISIPRLPDLWLEYGVMDREETYTRPGPREDKVVKTKPVWIRNTYVASRFYVNTFGGAKEHVKQLSFLCQKPFDYDFQAGVHPDYGEIWKYTEGKIDTTRIKGQYVSLTGFNERFSPLVRALKDLEGIPCSYRPGDRVEPTADGLFMQLKKYVRDALGLYHEANKERAAHQKRCSDILTTLSIHGTTIRKFSIILSSVFVRNALPLPGHDPIPLGGVIGKNPSSMFGYFVYALFYFAEKHTSAEWANVSINHPDHAILRSVRKLRFKKMYRRYKLSETGFLTRSDYLKVYHLLRSDFMGRLSTEPLPE